ncbi:hypothetical protein BGW41_006504 [Actinomortierella wolfii]|nr:hypothetical protein BGW41_006504 [Actinomortierella wolfii]
MSDIDTPLCVAANNHSIYVASFSSIYDNSHGTPILSIYSSQQFPPALSSIQWKREVASYINHTMFNIDSILEDGSYLCAVDDIGSFMILTESPTNRTGEIPTAKVQGLLFNKPSNPNKTDSNGLSENSYARVSMDSIYPCITVWPCDSHLYALPATPGSPSNFGFVTYSTISGFFFGTLERTAKKINIQVSSPIPPVDGVSDWTAFGYNNNQLAAVSPLDVKARTISLDARGQPVAGAAINKLAASVVSGYGIAERGFMADVNGRSYFSCSSRSKDGQYAMFSIEANSVSKVAEFPERKDGMVKGIVPVPNHSGNAPTWALAYKSRRGSLYSLVLSGIVRREQRQQRKSQKTQAQEELQLTEDNHITTANPDGPTLTAGNSEVKDNNHLPNTGETWRLQELSQFQRLHHRPYPLPQPAPHLAHLYRGHPHPEMYQNVTNEQKQSTPSTTICASPATVPSLVPAPVATTATAPSVVSYSTPADQLQQELQFSSHPRPNVVTTVGDADP